MKVADLITVAVAGVATVLPEIVPLLSPPVAHVLTGVLAALASVFHLYQTPPSWR